MWVNWHFATGEFKCEAADMSIYLRLNKVLAPKPPVLSLLNMTSLKTQFCTFSWKTSPAKGGMAQKQVKYRR